MERNFSDSQKSTIWGNYFGASTSATDAFGKQMTKSNFEADHIFPFAKGGKTIVENGMPLAKESNDIKSDNIEGIINGKAWEVKVLKSDNKIGVLYVNGQRISK